jgi:hypothetical protein
MNGDLAVVLALFGIIFGLIVILRSILNYRIKMHMIRSGHLDENAIRALNQSAVDFKLDNLKWGIILLFGGIGLIVLEYVKYEYESPLPYGIEAVCLAFGFLTYYLIAKNQVKAE